MQKVGHKEDFRKVLFILHLLQMCDCLLEVLKECEVTVTISRRVKITLNDNETRMGVCWVFFSPR